MTSVADPVKTTQRARVVGVVAALAAAVSVYAIRQVDADLYGYLAYGRVFAERGVHGPDPFAYTSAGTEWVAFEYLSQLALWLMFDRLGPMGLIALKCAIGGAAALFLWRAVRTATSDLVIALPAFFICVSPMSRYFLFRPQLVTFAGFALFVAVIFRFLLKGRAALWPLPLVMAVWANAHGGFVAGLGALALGVALRVAANLNDGSRPGLFSGTRPLLVTLAACTAATLINPWGVRLWQYVITELLHDTNRRHIAEWGPGWTVDPWSMFALSSAAATLVCVTWLAGGRQVAGIRPGQWLLSALPLVAMSFASVRHVPVAVIWAAPVIAILGRAARERRPRHLFAECWPVIELLAFVPVALTILYVSGNARPQIAAGREFLGGSSPCGAIGFIRTQGAAGNIFTPLWWGSYLTWELQPAIRVSMDGRNISAFERETVRQNLQFYSGDVTTADLDVPLRYPTNFLLVPVTSTVLRLLRADDRWRLIYEDTDAVLFARAGDTDMGAAPPVTPGIRQSVVCGPTLERE